MSSKSESLSLATPTANKPYTLTVDSIQNPGVWRYSLANPDGTVTRDAGELIGADVDVLALYALAVAALSIPKGVSLEVRTTSPNISSMGQRLTKPALVPQLPYYPFAEARRAAWKATLPGLANFASVKWQAVLRNESDVMALAEWARTKR